MINQSIEYNSTSRLVSLLERHSIAHLKRSLSSSNLNITVEEWKVLFYLWYEDGLNQNDIAARANKEKSTITRKIDSLEKKGFVKRITCDSDARNKKIELTEKGKSIEQQSMDLANEITLSMEQGIPDNEILFFKKILKSMIGNLQLN